MGQTPVYAEENNLDSGTGMQLRMQLQEKQYKAIGAPLLDGKLDAQGDSGLLA